MWLPGYGIVERPGRSLSPEQLEHLASYASERSIAWLEGMCDLAAESGETDALVAVIDDDEELQDWMERAR